MKVEDRIFNDFFFLIKFFMKNIEIIKVIDNDKFGFVISDFLICF